MTATRSKKAEQLKNEENAKKVEESKETKDEKTEEVSDEDKQLQDELVLCVERLKDSNIELRYNSLKILADKIRSATSSLTSVPKPLKFLRPHWDAIVASFDAYGSKEKSHTAWFLHAEIISVLGMTSGDEKELNCLKYRLLAETFEGDRPVIDAQESMSNMQISDEQKNQKSDAREQASKGVGAWGHEYVKHLCLEISTHWETITEDAVQQQTILSLVKDVVPFLMAFNAETDACDLLMEIGKIETIPAYIDKLNIERVCLYLTSCQPFVPEGENTRLLEVVLRIRRNFDHHVHALYIALRLNRLSEVEDILINCSDVSIRKQMCYILGRQNVFINLEESELAQKVGIDTDEQDELTEIMSNGHLSQNFLNLARELDIMEAKTPEDVYKTHLENTRPGYGPSGSQVEGARMNLAAAYVNAFVNCGFGKDKNMDGEEGNKFIHRNRDHGMLAATASLGAIKLWDVDEGLSAIDKFLYAPEEQIKAGALLGCGVVSAGIRNECDPALALLSDYFTHTDMTLRKGAVFGIGLAYAGSNREDITTLLLDGILKEKEEMTESERPEKVLVTENAPNSEVISLVALSCGLISVGTSNKDVVLSILDIIKDKASKTDQPVLAGDSIYRILSLGLALPFMCQQETVDSTIAALNEIIPDGHCEQDFRDFTLVLLDALAYTATGNVLKIQKFLHICSENANEKKSTETEEKKEESAKKDEKKSDKKDEKKDDKKKEETKAKVVFSKHSVAVLGIGLIAMNDDIGTDMSFRVLSSILRYGEPVIKKTVPLALAILCTSNPKLSVLDTLAKLSHDNDVEVAQNAILAQGIVASGTNNARLAQQLRQLAQYYAKDASSLFMVRLTQGFVHMGKGTMTLQAYQGDRTLLNNVSLAGLTTLMVACTDNNGIILGGKNAHYLLYSLMLSTQPKVLQTFDEDLKPLQVSVRVGLAVDTVGQAGRPKTITGFTTRTTPVLLNYGERAELATDEYLPLSPVFEGFVILRKNPNFEKE